MYYDFDGFSIFFLIEYDIVCQNVYKTMSHTKRKNNKKL